MILSGPSPGAPLPPGATPGPPPLPPPMRMPISEETRAALDLLKDVRSRVAAAEDLKADRAVNDDLNTLISVLESPVFQSILNIKDSLRELKRQVSWQLAILFVVTLTVVSLVYSCRSSSTLPSCRRTLTSLPPATSS